MQTELEALGWDAERATQFAAHAAAGLVPARVVAVHRGRLTLRGEAGELFAPVSGAIRSRARELGPAELPVTGDWVAVEPQGAVRDLLPRHGAIRRGAEGKVEVVAANVDLALITTSLNRDLNLRRLERLLAIAADAGTEAVVLLTKGDLCDDPAAAAERVEGELGVPVTAVSVLGGWGVEAVRERLLPRRTAVLLGSSGVGKSTLVNRLLGEERQRTMEIRDDDRGRHATRHRELFALPWGALIVDTPGVREVALPGGEGLDETFDDVAELAARCRFSDCTHGSEPGCAVQAAIAEGSLAPERLAAMEQLQREARWIEERQEGAGGAARRGRERASNRAFRSIGHRRR